MNIELDEVDFYYYEQVPNGQGGYDIIEKPSGNTIYTNLKRQPATAAIIRLNLLGHGFRGWTPSFCLPQQYKINKI